MFERARRQTVSRQSTAPSQGLGQTAPPTGRGRPFEASNSLSSLVCNSLEFSPAVSNSLQQSVAHVRLPGEERQALDQFNQLKYAQEDGTATQALRQVCATEKLATLLPLLPVSISISVSVSTPVSAPVSPTLSHTGA